jgi:glycerophosphoryl diester phosphodiesterase
MRRILGVQGHRGARALFPENTLQGFIEARRLGVQAFELDVGMTADGVVVVSHDIALNPDLTRDAAGRWIAAPGPAIWSLTWNELRQYDVGRVRPRSPTALRFPQQRAFDGARIPTLAEILAAVPDAWFTVEIKTDPAFPDCTAAADILAMGVLDVVDAAGAAARVVIEAFDWRVQRFIRRTRPEIRLAWLTRSETVRHAALWWDKPATGSVPECVAAEGGPIWAPDYRDLTEAQVEQAHALGLLVLPWTINQPADMRRLFNWQVDGLISDRPDLAMLEFR